MLTRFVTIACAALAVGLLVLAHNRALRYDGELEAQQTFVEMGRRNVNLRIPTHHRRRVGKDIVLDHCTRERGWPRTTGVNMSMYRLRPRCYDKRLAEEPNLRRKITPPTAGCGKGSEIWSCCYAFRAKTSTEVTRAEFSRSGEAFGAGSIAVYALRYNMAWRRDPF